jgi:hypothetical protein
MKWENEVQSPRREHTNDHLQSRRTLFRLASILSPLGSTWKSFNQLFLSDPHHLPVDTTTSYMRYNWSSAHWCSSWETAASCDYLAYPQAIQECKILLAFPYWIPYYVLCLPCCWSSFFLTGAVSVFSYSGWFSFFLTYASMHYNQSIITWLQVLELDSRWLKENSPKGKRNVIPETKYVCFLNT